MRRINYALIIVYSTILFSCSRPIDFKKNYVGQNMAYAINECGTGYDEGVNQYGQKFLLYEKSKFEGTTFYFDESNNCIYVSFWMNSNEFWDCKNYLDKNFNLIKSEETYGRIYHNYESSNLKYRLFDGAKDGCVLDITYKKNTFTN
jgi:hypothetical protein